MNIYDYLGSPDIAAHCEAIHHVFNPLEVSTYSLVVDVSQRTAKSH